MKYGPLGFPIVPHKDVALSHHVEVGPFPSNSGLPSVPGPFLGAGEDLGRPREVVDVFKANIVDFTCVILQVQGNIAYPLGLDDPPNSVDFCIVPLI